MGRREEGGGCGVVYREKKMAFTRGGLCGYKLYFECRLPQMGGVWWPSWYLAFEILLIKEKGEGYKCSTAWACTEVLVTLTIKTTLQMAFYLFIYLFFLCFIRIDIISIHIKK